VANATSVGPPRCHPHCGRRVGGGPRPPPSHWARATAPTKPLDVGRLGADSDGGNTTAWWAALHGGATMVGVLGPGSRRSAGRDAGLPSPATASPQPSARRAWPRKGWQRRRQRLGLSADPAAHGVPRTRSGRGGGGLPLPPRVVYPPFGAVRGAFESDGNDRSAAPFRARTRPASARVETRVVMHILAPPNTRRQVCGITADLQKIVGCMVFGHHFIGPRMETMTVDCSHIAFANFGRSRTMSQSHDRVSFINLLDCAGRIAARCGDTTHPTCQSLSVDDTYGVLIGGARVCISTPISTRPPVQAWQDTILCCTRVRGC